MSHVLTYFEPAKLKIAKKSSIINLNQNLVPVMIPVRSVPEGYRAAPIAIIHGPRCGAGLPRAIGQGLMRFEEARFAMH
jgi:hypothetical protein